MREHIRAIYAEPPPWHSDPDYFGREEVVALPELAPDIVELAQLRRRALAGWKELR